MSSELELARQTIKEFALKATALELEAANAKAQIVLLQREHTRPKTMAPASSSLQSDAARPVSERSGAEELS